MVSGEGLAADLGRAECGDRLAWERFYDQTCADAWHLALCVAPDHDAAQRAMLGATAIFSNRRTTNSCHC